MYKHQTMTMATAHVSASSRITIYVWF